jgi:hypothetical protein
MYQAGAGERVRERERERERERDLRGLAASALVGVCARIYRLVVIRLCSHLRTCDVSGGRERASVRERERERQRDLAKSEPLH